MVTPEGDLINLFYNKCRWCSYYRGEDSTLFCDKDIPCISRDEQYRLQKILQSKNSGEAEK